MRRKGQRTERYALGAGGKESRSQAPLLYIGCSATLFLGALGRLKNTSR